MPWRKTGTWDASFPKAKKSTILLTENGASRWKANPDRFHYQLNHPLFFDAYLNFLPRFCQGCFAGFARDCGFVQSQSFYLSGLSIIAWRNMQRRIIHLTLFEWLVYSFFAEIVWHLLRLAGSQTGFDASEYAEPANVFWKEKILREYYEDFYFRNGKIRYHGNGL